MSTPIKAYGVMVAEPTIASIKAAYGVTQKRKALSAAKETARNLLESLEGYGIYKECHSIQCVLLNGIRYFVDIEGFLVRVVGSARDGYRSFERLTVVGALDLLALGKGPRTLCGKGPLGFGVYTVALSGIVKFTKSTNTDEPIDGSQWPSGMVIIEGRAFLYSGGVLLGEQLDGWELR